MNDTDDENARHNAIKDFRNHRMTAAQTSKRLKNRRMNADASANRISNQTVLSGGHLDNNVDHVPENEPAKSYLEALPAELLEVIAWYSLNPRLTMVSKTIKSKLPNAFTLKMDMLIFAFIRRISVFADSNNIPIRSHVGKTIQKQNFRVSSNCAAMREQILADPQFTFAHFVRAMDIVIVSYVRQNWDIIQQHAKFNWSFENRTDDEAIDYLKFACRSSSHHLSCKSDATLVLDCHERCSPPPELTRNPLFGGFCDSADILKLPYGEAKRKLLMLLYTTSISYRAPGSDFESLPGDLILKAIKEACNTVDSTTLGILLGILNLKTTGPLASQHDELGNNYTNELWKMFDNAIVHFRWDIAKTLIQGYPDKEFIDKALGVSKKLLLMGKGRQRNREIVGFLDWCSKHAEKQARPKFGWRSYGFFKGRSNADRCVKSYLISQNARRTLW